MNKETRYTLDSVGRIRQWQCWYGINEEGKHGIFYTDGLLNEQEEDDFKMKDPIFKEAKEKNVGKANYLSPEAQAKLMVEQEVGKKERSNYYVTPELARSQKLWLPMLCPSGMKWKDYAGTDKVSWPAWASPKLDGARANAMDFQASIQNGQVYLQTRTGKEWLNCEHIAKELQPILQEYPTWIIDGEFYNHDYRDNFEDLMSIIKKQKPTEEQKKFSAENVQYHVYDIFDTEYPKLNVSDRQNMMFCMFYYEELSSSLKMCVPLFSTLCMTEEDFDKFHSECLDKGYEGSILRLEAPYDVDKRSKNLLKRKELFDCEMKILDVIEGEGTNKGIAAKVIVDLTKNGVSGMNADHQALLMRAHQDAGMAKGWDHDKCRALLENKDDVIGKMATIEYFEITGHGVCRFPKLKAIRDYE